MAIEDSNYISAEEILLYTHTTNQSNWFLETLSPNLQQASNGGIWDYKDIIFQ